MLNPVTNFNNSKCYQGPCSFHCMGLEILVRWMQQLNRSSDSADSVMERTWTQNEGASTRWEKKGEDKIRYVDTSPAVTWLKRDRAKGWAVSASERAREREGRASRLGQCLVGCQQRVSVPRVLLFASFVLDAAGLSFISQWTGLRSELW